MIIGHVLRKPTIEWRSARQNTLASTRGKIDEAGVACWQNLGLHADHPSSLGVPTNIRTLFRSLSAGSLFLTDVEVVLGQ